MDRFAKTPNSICVSRKGARPPRRKEEKTLHDEKATHPTPFEDFFAS
jgi:hypothetical protein